MGFCYLGVMGLCCWCLFLLLTPGLPLNLPLLSFEEGYTHLFGEANMAVLKDGKSVRLHLDERTGSGFVSQDLYFHGFFSAFIKLPADYTAGPWATNGGKYKVNYKYSPYIAEFSDLVLHGCAVDPTGRASTCDEPPAIPNSITAEQRMKMESFRKKHLVSSYCYDKTRYPLAPRECVVNDEEGKRLRNVDPVTFGKGRRRHGKWLGRSSA